MTGRGVAEMARQSLDNLNQIYARVQDSMLIPLAKDMERAMHKFRDLEVGDSVMLSERARRAGLWYPKWTHENIAIDRSVPFYQRPVIVAIDEHRSCTLRFVDGRRENFHAQWLQRITRDEVEA